MTIVHHLMKVEVGCLCGITDRDEIERARQRYICRPFHFTNLRMSKEVLDQV
jgi:hypothetical protein